MPSLHRLTWIQRITLILFVTVLTNWVVDSATGYSLIGGDLFNILLLVFLVLLILTLMRKVVWGVWNRLFVTYLVIGVLPLLSMAAKAVRSC